MHVQATANLSHTGPGGVTPALGVTIEYDQTSVDVHIVLAQPLPPGADREAALLSELHRLIEALQTVGQSRDNIRWRLPPP